MGEFVDLVKDISAWSIIFVWVLRKAMRQGKEVAPDVITEAWDLACVIKKAWLKGKKKWKDIKIE